jgi:hypothetical protein
MSDGKSIGLECSRCGSDKVRTSRQALNLLTWVYCVSFRRRRYRCVRCNCRFYGQRRYPNLRQSGYIERAGVAQKNEVA